MRVVHLNTERGWRGGERQTFLLARELMRRGHESVVVCRPGGSLDDICRRANVPAFPLSPIVEMDPFAALKLRKFLVKKSTGVILHAHTAHAVGLGAMAVRNTNIPFLATRRVDFAIRMNPFSRWKYQSLDGLVAISKRVHEMALQAGIPPEKLSVISSGIEPGNYPRASDRAALRQAKGFPADEQIVVNVAALAPHKDQTTLLKAMQTVLRKKRDTRLLILGEGSLRSELEELSRRLGISNRVSFLGHREDVLDFIALADIFVLSSVEEGLGTSLLDAMAIGVPTVATRTGGIPDVYGSTDAPELVPARDPEALARGILAVLEERGETSRRVDRGRERVRGFSVTAMADRYERIYSDLLGNHD